MSIELVELVNLTKIWVGKLGVKVMKPDTEVLKWATLIG